MNFTAGAAAETYLCPRPVIVGIHRHVSPSGGAIRPEPAKGLIIRRGVRRAKMADWANQTLSFPRPRVILMTGQNPAGKRTSGN